MNTLIHYALPQVGLADCIDDFFGNCSLSEYEDKLIDTNWPETDITEDSKSYFLKADLPGVDKKDIKIKIDKNILSIEGEKKKDHKQDNNKYYRYERNYGRFIRSFMIPDGTDVEKVEAKMVNGVLELTIPKILKKQRTIEVKI